MQKNRKIKSKIELYKGVLTKNLHHALQILDVKVGEGGE